MYCWIWAIPSNEKLHTARADQFVGIGDRLANPVGERQRLYAAESFGKQFKDAAEELASRVTRFKKDIHDFNLRCESEPEISGWRNDR